MKLRKLMIVIEDTGTENGKGFQVYLTGDVERLSDKSVKHEDYCPAEYWGMSLMSICAQVLEQTGAMKSKVKKKVPSNAH